MQRTVCGFRPRTSISQGESAKGLPSPVSNMNPSITLDTIIADMRDWLFDCYEDDVIHVASTRIIIIAVSNTYDGGVEAFMFATYGNKWARDAMQIITDEGF